MSASDPWAVTDRIGEEDYLGIGLAASAKRRSDAYYAGLDAAIDGLPSTPAAYTDVPVLIGRYQAGYSDGVAQLASYPHRTAVTNPARDHG